MSFVRSRRTTTAAASRVLVTDAKPDAVTFYETLGFLALEGVSEGLLVSEPMPMFLGIETIATALAPGAATNRLRSCGTSHSGALPTP